MKTTPQTNVITLTPWQILKNSLPSYIERATIFDKEGETGYLDDQLVLDHPNIQIHYTGELLNHEDKAVWLQLVRIAKQQGSHEIYTSTGYLLATLNQEYTPENAEWLKDRISKLIHAHLTIISSKCPIPKRSKKPMEMWYGFIRAYAYDSEEGDWEISLERRYSDLFH